MSCAPSGVKANPRNPVLGNGPPGGKSFRTTLLLQVENIEVIDVREAEPPALLIIEHKSVEGGSQKGLHALERAVL
jgi:hypothetical protein